MKSDNRDVEELLIERGVEVDHVTAFRWVIGGLSTRRTSRSMVPGGTCTRRFFKRALTVVPVEVSGTRTIRSRPTTVSSNTGSDLCADYEPIVLRR